MQKQKHTIKNIIKLGVFLILSVFAFLSYSYFTRAQVPDFVNYQGRLMDSSGNPITTPTTIQFSLYNHPTNGSPGGTPSSAGPLLWTETYDGSNPNCQQITPGADGIFAQHLGDCVSFPSYLDFTQEYYLGVKIGSDNEATPRVPLSTHPYAFTSKRLYAENEDVYITTGTSGNIVIQSANDVLLYDTNASVGVAGEILSSTGSGIEWISPGSFSAGALWDTDHDTGVQVEKNADDDTLRIDTAGSQRMAIDNAGNLLLSDIEPISFINPGNLQGLLFRDDKFALRIGETNNNEWDDVNIGRGSFASGRNNIVSGNYSSAFGGGNNINDVYATAMGRYHTVTGSYAVAGGFQNTAGGYASAVFGQTNQATDVRAMAWGMNNQATADEATAFGLNTRANGARSLAFGRNTLASGPYATAFGNDTQATNDYATAFGRSTIAGNDYATAWGNNAEATGYGATAFGYNTTASGQYSLSSGYYSEASGNNAVALNDTIANSYMMTAIGRFNENVSGQSLTDWVDTDQLFVIGNGTGWQNANRSNALTVLKNGTITAPSFSLAEIDAAGDTALTTKEYVNNQLMWEILPASTGGMRIQPKDHSVRQVFVQRDDNSYTQFKVRNDNDTGNGAGAIIELKGSGADYTNNMYIGKYGASFWIPELRDNGAVLTDKNLVIGTASDSQEIHFVTGNSYSDLRPVVVADNEGFRYTSDLSATFVDRTLVDKEYVDDAIVNSVNSIYVLDGTLTGDRVLNADDNDLTFTRLDGFTVLADDGAILTGIKSKYWQTKDNLYLGIEQKDTNQITYLNISNNDFTIGSTHANFKGATYAADYSSNFVDNSLVTKKYVDDNIGVLTWTPGSSGIHSAQTIGNETTGGDAVGDYSVVGGNNSFAGGNSSVAFGENATAGYAPNVTDDPNGLKPITSLTDDMFNISNSDLYAGATHVELYYDAGGGTYTPYITTAITWIDDQFNGTSNVTVADDYSAHTPVRALFKIIGAPNTFDNAFALGKNVLAGNNGAFAFGGDTTASGQNAMAIGLGSTASSYGEIALGIYNTSYSPNDTVNFDSNDRLLVIGNGVDDSNRSDAFVMYKNGLSTFNNITSYGADYSANYTNRSLVDKEYVDNQIGPFDTTNNVTSNENDDYANDDFVFGSPSLANDGNDDHDKRFFFDKSKAAFRAGYTPGSEWDDANVGTGSIALGSGYVDGEGSITNAPIASGIRAIAIGIDAVASGTDSFATAGAEAVANTSFATTNGTANASGSVAMIGGTTNGIYSVAMGGTTTGDHAVSMGLGTTAAAYSVAMGYLSTASGQDSVAMGQNTSALKLGSIAMGLNSVASGSGAVALGKDVFARSYGEVAFGLYNTDYVANNDVDFDPTDRIFVIGNGTGPATGDRSDALVILKNGNIGIGVSIPSAQLHTTGTVRFANFGAGTLVTDANGNVSVSSDERLKNIQGTFDRGLSELMSINPIEYKWKKETGYDTENSYYGFSAQNVKLSIPEAVGEDNRGYLTLSDRPILATVINAIKEQQGQIEEFKNDDRVIEDLQEALKNIDFDELENRIDDNENLMGEINNSIKNIIDEIKQIWEKVTKNSDDIDELKKENDELKKELCKENNDYSWCDNKEGSEDESNNEEGRESQQPVIDETDENAFGVEINNNSEVVEETAIEELTGIDNEQVIESQNDNNESSDNVAGN